MKFTLLVATTFLLLACGSSQDIRNSGSDDTTGIDSCEIALKFENAKAVEGMVDHSYSGDLNNYWGDDKTKLDYKHVFEDGKLVKSYFYYENQQVQEEYSFKCGALHGQQKWFYEDGKLAKTIPYSYGYRNGTGLRYDKDGNLIQKVTFRNDSIIGKIQNFDKSGNLIDNDTVSE